EGAALRALQRGLRALEAVAPGGFEPLPLRLVVGKAVAVGSLGRRGRGGTRRRAGPRGPPSRALRGGRGAGAPDGLRGLGLAPLLLALRRIAQALPFQGHHREQQHGQGGAHGTSIAAWAPGNWVRICAWRWP